MLKLFAHEAIRPAKPTTKPITKTDDIGVFGYWNGAKIKEYGSTWNRTGEQLIEYLRIVIIEMYGIPIDVKGTTTAIKWNKNKEMLGTKNKATCFKYDLVDLFPYFTFAAH